MDTTWLHIYLPPSAVRGKDVEEDGPRAGAIPQEPSPLTLLLVETMPWPKQEGSAAAVLPPYLSQLLHRDSEHNARDMMLMTRNQSLLQVPLSSQH